MHLKMQSAVNAIRTEGSISHSFFLESLRRVFSLLALGSSVSPRSISCRYPHWEFRSPLRSHAASSQCTTSVGPTGNVCRWYVYPRGLFRTRSSSTRRNRITRQWKEFCVVSGIETHRQTQERSR